MKCIASLAVAPSRGSRRRALPAVAPPRSGASRHAQGADCVVLLFFGQLNAPPDGVSESLIPYIYRTFFCGPASYFFSQIVEFWAKKKFP